MKTIKKMHGAAHSFFRRILPHSPDKIKHWKDMNEMHAVLDGFPGYFKALVLELMEKPMSRDEMWESVMRLENRLGKRHRGKVSEDNLDRDLAFALESGALEERDGKFLLTPGGREIGEHMQEMIPSFMGGLLSPKTVSIFTVAIHVLLSILKLAFGLISGSAGLIADGIDNTVDTISSVLVWLGITFDREKLVSIFIIIMMFISVGGVGIASYNKITHPEPIKEGLGAFIVSLACGFTMLLLSAYQYAVGRRSNSFAIMCQAVDSRNHFLTSLLVCGGIILSNLAETFDAEWLYYADAAASIVIGLLILKSAIELVIELVRPGDEEAQVSHFWGNAQERLKRKLVLEWLSEQLAEGSLEGEVLEERFSRHFCEEVPRIMALSGLGYHPESVEDLHRYLELFIKQRKLEHSAGKYILTDKS
jgi:hypothetical protein